MVTAQSDHTFDLLQCVVAVEEAHAASSFQLPDQLHGSCTILLMFLIEFVFDHRRRRW